MPALERVARSDVTKN